CQGTSNCSPVFQLCNADGSSPANPNSYVGNCCSYYGTPTSSSGPLLSSDGTLKSVITPTGSAVVFGLTSEAGMSADGGAPLRSLPASQQQAAQQQRISYFLDPNQVNDLEEFKTGYVQSQRTYYPNGTLASEIDYSSVVPASGNALGTP